MIRLTCSSCDSFTGLYKMSNHSLTLCVKCVQTFLGWLHNNDLLAGNPLGYELGVDCCQQQIDQKTGTEFMCYFSPSKFDSTAHSWNRMIVNRQTRRLEKEIQFNP